MITDLYLIDTETTGLRGFPVDHVVDVGVCRIDLSAGSFEPVYSSIVGHDVSLWNRNLRESWIFENSDLTLSDVASAPPVASIADDLNNILSGEFVTSYNVDFDFRKFLRHDPFFMHSYVAKVLPDPMLAATPVLKIAGSNGYKWPRLEEAYSSLCPDDPAGIGCHQDHRALSDAKVASCVLIELHKRGHYKV